MSILHVNLTLLCEYIKYCDIISDIVVYKSSKLWKQNLRKKTLSN